MSVRRPFGRSRQNRVLGQSSRESHIVRSAAISTIERLENRRLLAAQPDLGINFGSDRTDANGAPFAMQPTDTAGVVPIMHWNNADTNMGMATGLTDSTGATSTVGV